VNKSARLSAAGARQRSNRPQRALSRGTFDIMAAVRVPGSDFAGRLSGNATVRVTPAQYYVLLLANTGSGAPTDVLYQFATYSGASPGARHRQAPNTAECSASALTSAGALTSARARPQRARSAAAAPAPTRTGTTGECRRPRLPRSPRPPR
jgi:hypothetical protein